MADLVAGGDIAHPVLSWAAQLGGHRYSSPASNELDAPLPALKAGETRRIRLCLSNWLLTGVYLLAALTGEAIDDMTTTINIYKRLG
jgi:hypothetical protein